MQPTIAALANAHTQVRIKELRDYLVEILYKVGADNEAATLEGFMDLTLAEADQCVRDVEQSVVDAEFFLSNEEYETAAAYSAELGSEVVEIELEE
jgi:hypothetical protein